jgi:hypothetical protein
MTDCTLLATIPAIYFAAWNGRDEHALEPFFASEFIWIDPLLPVPVTALKGAQQFLAGSWKSFPDVRFELIGGPMIDAAHGRVSQEWRMLATSAASGKSIDLVGIDVWQLEQGLVTKMQACYDAAELMRQIGGV